MTLLACKVKMGLAVWEISINGCNGRAGYAAQYAAQSVQKINLRAFFAFHAFFPVRLAN
jgi:hypothetical protein